MPIYRSLTALILTGSISSCDCVGDFIRKTEWAKEEVARARAWEEREHLQKQSYHLCEETYQDCFSVEEAKMLKKTGIQAEPANMLVFLHAQGIIEWQKAGCKLEHFPPLLKEVQVKGLGTEAQNAKYYALAACTGKTTLEELEKYQPRFRELRLAGRPGAVYLAEHNVKAETANAFPPNYNAREIVAFLERGKNMDLALQYADVKQEYHLSTTEIADLDDQHLTPEILQWYFNLEKEFPAIELNVADVITCEKAVQEKRLTRDKVRMLARRVQEEDPLLELLREKVFSLSEHDL